VNSLLFMVYQFSWTSCCEFIIIHGIPVVMDFLLWIHYYSCYTSFHGLRAVNSLLFMVYQLSWTSCCEFIIIHGIPVFMDFVLWIHYYSWYTSCHGLRAVNSLLFMVYQFSWTSWIVSNHKIKIQQLFISTYIYTCICTY
jgi:hypothetical protein